MLLALGFTSGFLLQSFLKSEQPHQIQAVNIDGVYMKLMDAHPEGSYYRLDLCYRLPDGHDWLMTSPSSRETTYILFNDYQVAPFEEGTTRWKYSSTSEVVERCGYLLFYRPDPSFRELTLVVSRLYAYHTDYAECESIRKRMSDLYSFASLECMEVSGINSLALVQVPLQVLDDRIILNQMDKLIIKRYEGPWQFSFINE